MRVANSCDILARGSVLHGQRGLVDQLSGALKSEVKTELLMKHAQAVEERTSFDIFLLYS